MHTLTFEELDDQFQERAEGDTDPGPLTFRVDIAGQLFTIEVTDGASEWTLTRGPTTGEEVRAGSFDYLETILRKTLESSIMDSTNEDIRLADRNIGLNERLDEIEDEYGEWFPRTLGRERYRDVFGVEPAEPFEVATMDIEVVGAVFTVELGYYHNQRPYITIEGPEGNKPVVSDDPGRDPSDIRYQIGNMLGDFLSSTYTNVEHEMVFHQ